MTSRLRAPLAPLEIAGRLGRLRERFGPAEIDALLVTKLANVRYLTGFTGSAAVLLVGPGSALFVTDGRYAQRSHEELGAAGTGAEIEIALTASAQRVTVSAKTGSASNNSRAIPGYWLPCPVNNHAVVGGSVHSPRTTPGRIRFSANSASTSRAL